MGKTVWRITTSFLIASIVLATGGAASAATDDTARAASAMAYVGAQQLSNGSFPGFSSIDVRLCVSAIGSAVCIARSSGLA